MITIPTRKHHKSPFKHSKTIYIWRSSSHCPNQQYKNDFKWLKSSLQNGHQSIGDRIRIYTILLQDLMKRGVCRCGVEMLLCFICLFWNSLQQVLMSSSAKHIERKRPMHTSYRWMLKLLSGINEHLLAYLPKDDCRNANPKKDSMSQLQPLLNSIAIKTYIQREEDIEFIFA